MTSIQLKEGPAAWTNIVELVEDRAATFGDRKDIEIDGVAISYAELDRQSALVAANLHRLGVRKGDRVASFQENSMEQLLLWVGSAKSGAIWVPMNAGLVGDDLAYTLKDAAPKVLVVAAALIERLNVEAIDFPCAIIVAGGGGGESDFATLLQDAPPAPPVNLRPGDPAVIIYTGGTTGLPKGAVLPHFAWIAAGYRFKEAYSVTPDDRVMTVLTMFHVGGLMLGIMGPMVAGIPMHVERKFSVSTFWSRVRETGATIIDPVGTMIILLLQQPPAATDRDHRVRVMLGGTGQLPAHVAPAFTERFGIPMVGVYSLTECGGILIVNNPVGSDKPDANGKSWGWADIGIFDDDDIPLAPGEVGQIALRPRFPHIFMSGYHNNPQRTLECMPNQWLHTGDLGYLDEDGFLFFTGRQVHWMRRRGENISAYEVESILTRCPGVREAIVVGVPSELGEEEVKAFVIPEEAKPDPVAIVQWCEGRMAGFKIPRFFSFVDDFPRSATKMEVERAKLKALTNDDAWDREKVMGRRPALSR